MPDRDRIGVLNDNNFPFSIGRHVGTGQPDDTEFIIIRLERTLGYHSAHAIASHHEPA